MGSSRSRARKSSRSCGPGASGCCPGILLFFALTGPAFAKYAPQIVAAVGGSQLAGFRLPAPVFLDSYAQWVKNLSQIGLFAIIIIYGGIVSSERRSGTAALVLTKPVSRSGFVAAKMLVHAVFLAVTVMAGTVITWGGTALLFGHAAAAPLFAATGAWLAFGFLFLAVMTLLSVMVSSQAGAAGIGLGAYALVSFAATVETAGNLLAGGAGERTRDARIRQGFCGGLACCDLVAARSRARLTCAAVIRSEGTVTRARVGRTTSMRLRRTQWTLGLAHSPLKLGIVASYGRQRS